MQTYGFDARSTEAAQIIIRNLRKYIVRIRTTANSKGRASDSGRQAAATVFAGIVSSPGKKSVVSNGQLLQAVGVPKGGASRIAKKAKKDREQAKNERDYTYLGPKQKGTRKIPAKGANGWEGFRDNYLPNSTYVDANPAMNETIKKRDMYGEQPLMLSYLQAIEFAHICIEPR